MNKSKIYWSASGQYKTLLWSFIEYIILFGLIILQIIKPNIRLFLQESLFNYTGWIVKNGQVAISRVDEFINKIKEIDITEYTEEYNKLKNENNILKTKIIIQEKELAKISDGIKIINAKFGEKIQDYIMCSVSFYLNGDSKIIICDVLFDKEIEIKRNSLVINESGLVGRVLENYNKYDSKNNIKIQLIDDLGFRIPIISGVSFTRGIASGSGVSREMQIMYSNTTNFINKEPVFTSNDGNIIIPEIPVGNVVINERGDYVIKITNQIYNLAFLKIML